MAWEFPAFAQDFLTLFLILTLSSLIESFQIDQN